MTTYLLYGEATRSPEMRHEIAEPVMDELVFLEHEGRRIVLGGVLERAMLEKREDVVDEFWNSHDLGYEELVRDPSFPEALIGAELALRAVRRAGVSSVVVPLTFGVGIADHLRAAGIEVVVDENAWALRRRRKTPWEIEGIERAQRAADTAMLTAARMLREAEPTALGQLRFEGEILTAEMVREAMSTDLLSQGSECEDILVHTGDAYLRGHDVGMGPILPDTSCIVDCFPRDRKTGVHSDMTRTFVPGSPSPELKRLYDHCRRALDIALSAIRPGRNDAFARVADYFESEGFPTRRISAGAEPLQEGFFHSLGHGVGLQVHERPRIGLRAEEFVEGDVVAIEPGLYFKGIGGVRLEDTVVVTDQGPEHFTDPYPYDLAP